GRFREAMALHYRMLPLNDMLFLETNPGPLKAALAMMGKIEPIYRLPLCLPSPENCRRIRNVLETAGFDLPAADAVLAAAGRACPAAGAAGRTTTMEAFAC